MSMPDITMQSPTELVGPRMIPERSTYAPGEYMANPHRDMAQVVLEEKDGEWVPFTLYRHTRQGEEPVTVKIGMLPLEHRQFVHLDGKMFHQRDFTDALTNWRAGFYRLAKAEAPELGIDPIPNVRRLLSLGVSKRDPSKLIPIGYDPRPTDGEVDDDPIVDLSVLGGGWEAAPVKDAEKADAVTVTTEDDALRQENTSLLEEIERLKEREREREEMEAADPQGVVVPCGRKFKDNRGVAQHMATCENGCKAEEG